LLQADSWYDEKTGTYSIEVARPKKRVEIERLLKKVGRYYPSRDNSRSPTYRWQGFRFNSELLRGKNFSLNMLGSNQSDIFVKWLKFWDGQASRNSSRTGRVSWAQVNEFNVDEVQAFLVRSGYEAMKTTSNSSITSTGKVHRLSIRHRGVVRFTQTPSKSRPSGSVQGAQITTRNATLEVGCVEVDSGFLVVRQKGKVFVSGNCAGEPTITTYYTKDKHYSLLNGTEPFAPYWNAEGVLVISDIYLCTLSMFPKGQEVLLEAWNRNWPQGSFVDQWAHDKEVVKDYLGSPRTGFKAVALGLSYGMRPNKLRQTIRMFGWECTKEEAQKLYNNYWSFYSGLSKFIKAAGAKAKRQGYLVNEFGFRSSPEPNKAFNWFIQSSVNPIINIFTLKVTELAPWAEYIVIIHDEVVFEIPEERTAEFKKICDESEAYLNSIINWKGVTMRTGFKAGKTLYDAK
jgi:hypothetical protein